MNRRDLITFGAGALASQCAMAPIHAAPAAMRGLRLFDVRDYGAAGDGKILDNRAINAAIDACHASGGVAYAAGNLSLRHGSFEVERDSLHGGRRDHPGQHQLGRLFPPAWPPRPAATPARST